MMFCGCLPLGGGFDSNEYIQGLKETSIGDHYFGKFSYCTLQGNAEMEDDSQVVVDHGAVFCGVYDGHGGTRASRFVSQNLYNNLNSLVQTAGDISVYLIENAFRQTENDFLDIVEAEFSANNQEIASHGSSCLVGVLAGGILHYANLGDSRAVLGYEGRFGIIWPKQLTQDHNLKDDNVRREYEALNPGNDGLLVKEDGIWRIKGMLKVTGCIGDGNLKRDNLAIQDGEFHLPGRTQRPLVSATPSLQIRQLEPHDRFIIFATNGLWELLSNREAVREVNKGPPQGAAKRLVQKALARSAKKAGRSYDSLMRLAPGNRRKNHDDISVIVLFLDHDLLENIRSMDKISIRASDSYDGEIQEEVDEEMDLSFDEEMDPSFEPMF